MGSLEALHTYFSSPWPLVVLALNLGLLALLALYYRLEPDVRKRLSSLVGLELAILFLWLFLAGSLLFCLWLTEELEYGVAAVKTVLAGALVLGLAGALLLALVTQRLMPALVLEGLPLRPPGPEEGGLVSKVVDLASRMGLETPRLRLLDSGEPVSLALEGRGGAKVLVLSQGLLGALSPGELEAVLAHELAHLCHRDGRARLLTGALSRLLPWDPATRLCHAAHCRQREFRADAEAAAATGRPRAMARALVKLAQLEDRSPQPLGPLSSLLPVSSGCRTRLDHHGCPGRHHGWLATHPPLAQRVEQLVGPDAGGGNNTGRL